MATVGDWLASLGLAEYAGRFAENRIDFGVLRDLTDQDLEGLGVVLGDRKKILRAIRDLETAEKPGPQVAAAPHLNEAAERRQLSVMFIDLVDSTALSANLDPEDSPRSLGLSSGLAPPPSADLAVRSPNTWVMEFWPISATQRRTKTTRNARFELDWRLSTRSARSTSSRG